MPNQKSANFYALVLLMQMALVGVFTALDGFLFYVFWEMALIPIYFICLIWGDESRVPVTFKFFVYTLAGDLLMLLALLFLYYQTPGNHSFDIHALYKAGRELSDLQQGIIFWGLFLAFAIKMPIFPFHTWQPDTYTVAPMEGTMLLSGIMLKMGFYGVIRWLLPLVPLGVKEWGFTAIILSVIGIVYASIVAINQKDFKRLIAYASIAHVGAHFGGFVDIQQTWNAGSLDSNDKSRNSGICTVLHLRDHLHAVEYEDNHFFGRLKDERANTDDGFCCRYSGTIALPFTSGFVGEFLLLNALFQYNMVLGAIGGLTIILGAVYLLPALQYMMLGKNHPPGPTLPTSRRHEKIVLYPIVILVFVIGIHPDPLLQISEVAVADLLEVFSTFSANVK